MCRQADTGCNICAACACSGAAVLEEARESQADASAAAAAKKRKGPGGDATAAGGAATLELQSQRLLAGHSQCVAAVVWPSAGILVTGSWDHSVCFFWLNLKYVQVTAQCICMAPGHQSAAKGS